MVFQVLVAANDAAVENGALDVFISTSTALSFRNISSLVLPAVRGIDSV